MLAGQLMYWHLAVVNIFTLYLQQKRQQTLATAIDNGIVGTPTVLCEPTSISINATVRKKFSGRIFVKGFSDKPGCFKWGEDVKKPNLKVSLTECGLKRMRMLSDSTTRGMSVAATVIISFHPVFLTKVDRAYRIHCTYMEANKTVTSGRLEISMITTQDISVNMPMPVCKYEILKGDVDGEPIKFAVVGQSVYHRWSCEASGDQQGLYCIKVHSCQVSDGQNGNNSYAVLDETGCAMDRYVLNNLSYMNDGLTAGQEAHVVKFADKPAVYFSCQIQLLSIPSGGCQAVQPVCDKVIRGAAARRILDVRAIAISNLITAKEDSEQQRDDKTRRSVSNAGFDLPAPGLFVFDATDAEGLNAHRSAQQKQRLHQVDMAAVSVPQTLDLSSFKDDSDSFGVCLTSISFSILVTFLILLVASTAIATVVICRSAYARTNSRYLGRVRFQ